MARSSGIWWNRERNCYYTWYKGQKKRLDPSEQKARLLWAKLVGREVQPGDSNLLAATLINTYLDWSQANHSKDSHRRIKSSLLSFGRSLPKGMRTSVLVPYHLTKWLDQRCPRKPADGSKPASNNTRHAYASDVLGAFTWAAKQRIIVASPFYGFIKPPKTPRALCLTMDQWDRLFSEIDVDDPFRDYLLVLRNTGCRPQEARIMEARHIDFKAAKVRFKDGEVPGKKGDREILLNNEALEILRKWALIYPEGPILRNSRGRPWGKNSLNSRFQRLNKKLPFRAHCYVARHSMATEMLEAGASTGAVAAVLGHRDPTMVLKVYGKHIDKREKHLRECIDKTTAKRLA